MPDYLALRIGGGDSLQKLRIARPLSCAWTKDVGNGAMRPNDERLALISHLRRHPRHSAENRRRPDPQRPGQAKREAAGFGDGSGGVGGGHDGSLPVY